MASKFLSCIVLACAVSLSYAAERCDAAFTEQYHDCVRIVDSLRPDKGGRRAYSQWTARNSRRVRPAGCKGSCTESRRPAHAVTSASGATAGRGAGTAEVASQGIVSQSRVRSGAGPGRRQQALAWRAPDRSLD